MRCTSCASSFRFSAWILQCGECKEQYCTNCMKRVNSIYYCKRCGILIRRPPDINELMTLKAKDLQEYLKRHNVPTLGIVEKRELVELLCNHAIPVKNSKTSTVINKIFTNFETVFLNGDNHRQSPATSPTTTTTNRPSRPPPPQQQQQQQQYRSSFFPCSSSTNLNFGSCSSFNTTDDNRNHTLPKESRSQQSQQPAAAAAATTATASSSTPPPPPPQSQTIPESSPLPKRLPNLSDYHSAEDLANLSTKELKMLLTLNRVDYKGCVEKSELLEKAQMLWIDNYRQKSEVLQNNFEDLCKLCMDAPLDCVLLECGHIATCVDCGKKLAECPICRQYVTRVVRTFKA